MDYATATVETLSSMLLDAHSRTLALVEDLNDQQLMGEVLPSVNPLCWEVAHAAYFHETWVLRHLGDRAAIDKKSDILFDSIKIQHKDRWNLPLPTLQDIFAYMNEVLEYELELLKKIELDKRAKYFYLLALFHEDMHNEALICTRQTLSYPKPSFVKRDDRDSEERSLVNEDIEISGGPFTLGAERGDEFIFDNEKWSHKTHVAPFVIAKYAVSNEQYLEFIEAGGYQKQEYWEVKAWQWLQKSQLKHPVYWKQNDDKQWYVREFDQWTKLKPNCAVSHISWYEAQAFCNWSGRRLPTETEWEFAATSQLSASNAYHDEKIIHIDESILTNDHANLDCNRLGTASVFDYAESDTAVGCRQMYGNVWEWTSSSFEPYPGFSPDWYTEYSRPLFAKTKVLRGGAWPTRSRMLRATLRNYYGPDRNDVFAGFRTCAI